MLHSEIWLWVRVFDFILLFHIGRFDQVGGSFADVGPLNSRDAIVPDIVKYDVPFAAGGFGGLRRGPQTTMPAIGLGGAQQLVESWKLFMVPAGMGFAAVPD